MSSSPSTPFLTPSPSQSPSGFVTDWSSILGGSGGSSGPILGERLPVVKDLPRRSLRTRRRKVVMVAEPLTCLRTGASLSDSLTLRSFEVPTCALTKTARAPSRLNSTVFLLRPRLKLRPLIVSVLPMLVCIGETDVTTGYFFAFFLEAVAVAAPAVAGASRAPRAPRRAARRA